MKIEDMDKLYQYTIKLWDSIEQEQYEFEQNAQNEIANLQGRLECETSHNADLTQKLDRKDRELSEKIHELATVNNDKSRCQKALDESRNQQIRFKEKLAELIRMG